MGSSPEIITIIGELIIEFSDDSYKGEAKDIDVYLLEKGEIHVHTKHTMKEPFGTIYKNEIYETVEDLYVDKDLPKELIHKVKVHFGIYDS